LWSAQFNTAFKLSLEDLLLEDFHKATLPLAGNLQEKKQKIARIHELVYEKSHLLLPQGNTFLRTYISSYLESLVDSFVKEPEFTFGKSVYESIPFEKKQIAI